MFRNLPLLKNKSQSLNGWGGAINIDDEISSIKNAAAILRQEFTISHCWQYNSEHNLSSQWVMRELLIFIKDFKWPKFTISDFVYYAPEQFKQSEGWAGAPWLSKVTQAGHGKNLPRNL